MTKLSKSPDRNTFQKNAYLDRCEKDGKEPSPEYLKLFEDMDAHDLQLAEDPEWQQDNLEYDLRTSPVILEKCRAEDYYAQNLYAALCNMRWQKIEVFHILKDQYWSCSWRSAGGIVADILEKGDYIDWYCSGIKGDLSDDEYKVLTTKEKEDYDYMKRLYVPEGHVTDEIQADLKALGWQPSEHED